MLKTKSVRQSPPFFGMGFMGTSVLQGVMNQFFRSAERYGVGCRMASFMMGGRFVLRDLLYFYISLLLGHCRSGIMVRTVVRKTLDMVTFLDSLGSGQPVGSPGIMNRFRFGLLGGLRLVSRFSYRVTHQGRCPLRFMAVGADWCVATGFMVVSRMLYLCLRLFDRMSDDAVYGSACFLMNSRFWADRPRWGLLMNEFASDGIIQFAVQYDCILI